VKSADAECEPAEAAFLSVEFIDPDPRLAGAEWYDDEEFAAYGLTESETSRLRAWAQQWANDLNQRLGADEDDEV
jgi:hypothetical protein